MYATTTALHRCPRLLSLGLVVLSTSACFGVSDPPALGEGSSSGGDTGTPASSTAADSSEGSTSSPDTTGTTTIDPDDGSTSSPTSDGGTTTGETGETGDTGPTIVCGNGDVEEGEDCDGVDWQGAPCESLGQAAGTLACTDACTFDITGCVPPGMVLIPGGEFEMGSNFLDGSMPARDVHVDPFWIDQTEVTVAEYADCVAAGQCTAPDTEPVPYCNWNQPGRDDHPVNCVDWYQAVAYCDWVDGGTNRLPTEAEWEKAARGTDGRDYPWGDVPGPSCTHAVMRDAMGVSGCGSSTTLPVGSKPLGDSPYGLQDMSGNVWEWVADWYGPYDPAETDNPTGAAMGTARVLRGDSWYSDILDNFRAAGRGGLDPVNRWMIVGFRCARTPSAP